MQLSRAKPARCQHSLCGSPRSAQRTRCSANTQHALYVHDINFYTHNRAKKNIKTVLRTALQNIAPVGPLRDMRCSQVLNTQTYSEAMAG